MQTFGEQQLERCDDLESEVGRRLAPLVYQGGFMAVIQADRFWQQGERVLRQTAHRCH
jgi:hypothetical protein